MDDTKNDKQPRASASGGDVNDSAAAGGAMGDSTDAATPTRPNRRIETAAEEVETPETRVGTDAQSESPTFPLSEFSPSKTSPVYNKMHALWEAEAFAGKTFDERVALTVEHTGARAEEVNRIMKEASYLAFDDGNSGTLSASTSPVATTLAVATPATKET